MDSIRFGAAIALLALFALVVVRAPRALRVPESRIVWLATFTGCLALAAVGSLAPSKVIDGGLGGTNVINLLQNLLATIAFWLLVQATLTLDKSRFRWRSVWILPVMLISFSVPFFFIENRGHTSPRFIREHADQIALWAYASIYMLCVAALMAQTIAGVHGRRPRPYRIIRLGAGAIIVASLAEILYLTLRVVQVEPRGAVELVGDLFPVPFYGGVVLVSAGIFGFSFEPRVRAAAWRVLDWLVAKTTAVKDVDVDRLRSEKDIRGTYLLAVRLTDIANSQTLSLRERLILWMAAAILNWLMRAPTVVRLTVGPSQVSTEVNGL